jgi:hypothetical protein
MVVSQARMLEFEYVTFISHAQYEIRFIFSIQHIRTLPISADIVMRFKG